MYDVYTLLLSGIAAMICSAKVNTRASCSPAFQKMIHIKASFVYFYREWIFFTVFDMSGLGGNNQTNVFRENRVIYLYRG